MKMSENGLLLSLLSSKREAAGEREDLKKITGDRFRRLKVQIDPKLHVEAVKASAPCYR